MSTGAEQTPANGLRSVLKIAVPLVVLVAVVFGVTYLSIYTEAPPTDDKGKGAEGANSGEPPLRFFTSSRRWDPPLLDPARGYRNHPLLAPSAVASDGDPSLSYSLPDRVFQGFYEPSNDEAHKRATQFWFENRNTNPVAMQLKGLSCSSCTGGRVAAIPAGTVRALLQHSAVAALPVGPFNPFGVGLSQPCAALVLTRPEAGLQPLQWTEYGFDADPHATFKVPAAAAEPDKWAPQWGILELKFKVNGEPGQPAKPLHAMFATQVENTNQVGGNQFVIAFEVARPFTASPPSIDAGRFEPSSTAREYEVLVYTATRGPGSEFGDLETPSVAVTAPGGADPVKFIEVTKFERVPEDRLVEVAEQLAADQKRLTRVRAAYRLTVAVRPKVGETRMDIGVLERTVALTAGGATLIIPVKAVVRGAVWIDDDRTEFELGRFRGAEGVVQTIDVTTEKSGIELAVVKDECQPSKLRYELEKQPDRGGRGYYKLKVTVPPGQVFGAVKGMVVLEVKGPNPQRMRLPFKGTGTL